MTSLALDTASGVRLDLDDPRSEDIRLSDVAAGLSKVCRFGAQIPIFYSVAQHAVLVAELVERAGHPDWALAALHHDSHEAFAGDLPTPVKRRVDANSNDYYKQLCRSLDAAIAEAFGIPPWWIDKVVDAGIKGADEQALLIEARGLLHDGGEGLRDDRGLPASALESLPSMSIPLHPPEAEWQFLAAHKRLKSLQAAS